MNAETKPTNFRFVMQMMCIETHTVHERDCDKTENVLLFSVFFDSIIPPVGFLFWALQTYFL